MIYRERLYKYQLLAPECVQTDIIGYTVIQPLFNLSPNGMLYGFTGYAWDGPSGPTWDSKNFMTPSLFHDILYQMIREGFIPVEYKKNADELLKRLCVERGMCWIRAEYVLAGVKLFGSPSCKPGSGESEIKTAP